MKCSEKQEGGEEKEITWKWELWAGVVDAFLLQTRKIRAPSPHFHLPRDHLGGGSGLYHTKLAIKSLKVLCKIVSFYVTGTYTYLHAQVVGGRKKKQFCILDHKVSCMEKPTRSHNLNC